MSSWVLDNVIAVAILLVLFGITSAILLHIYSYRALKQSTLKSQIATFGADAVMTVLIGLLVANLFGSARERDHRVWVLRQDHLVRLKPVLQKDSEKLSEISRRIHVEGRAGEINKNVAQNETELDAIFSPDVLTEDLANHYSEYWQDKQRLRSDIKEQEIEFLDTVALVSKALSLPRFAEDWRINVAWSVLEKCLGKGPGATITFSSYGGYQYNIHGKGGGVGGPTKILKDHLAAITAFKRFQPDIQVTTHCESLSSRASKIYESTKRLSNEARLLAERTILSGECRYVKPE